MVTVAIIVAVASAMITGESGTPQVVSDKDSGHIHETVVIVLVTVHKRWLILSLAVALIGIGFLVWPSRKPPRIAS